MENFTEEIIEAINALCCETLSQNRQIVKDAFAMRNQTNATKKKLRKRYNLKQQSIHKVTSENLKEDYGHTMIYNKECEKSVFIPPEYNSKLFYTNDDISMLEIKEDEIKDRMKTTLRNLKNIGFSGSYWFKNELERFLKAIDDGTKKTIIEREWIRQIKILHIIHSKSPNRNKYPEVNDNIQLFLEECESFYQRCRDKILFKQMFTNYKNKGNEEKVIKKWLNEHLDLISVPSHLKWFFKLSSSITGERTEQIFYKKLKEILCKDDKGFVVLCDVKIDLPKNPKRQKQQVEFDVIIFSPKRKLVIAIEVKTSLADKKAFEQLKTYKDILEQLFGEFLDGWKYHPTLFVDRWTNEVPVNLHFISNLDNLNEWLDNILEEYPHQQILKEHENLQSVISLMIYINIQFTAPGYLEWLSETLDKIGTSENILFYTPEQQPIMWSVEYKRVIIQGGYGSGKSILLQRKSENLAEKGEKSIYFIDCDDTPKKTLYCLWLEEKWNERIKGSERKYSEYIEVRQKKFQDLSEFRQCVEDSSNFHLFFDGLMIVDDPLEKEDEELFKFSDRFLWIGYSDWISQEELNSNPLLNIDQRIFKNVKIQYTLRNPKNIIDVANDNLYITRNVTPSNFPTGPEIKYQEELPEKGLLIYSAHAIRETKSFLSHYDNFKHYSCDRNLDDKFPSHNIEEKNCLSYLKEERGVLVVDVETAKGFEWPTVITLKDDEERRLRNSILNKDSDICLSNVLSRCTGQMYFIECKRGDTLPTNDFDSLTSIFEDTLNIHMA